MKPISIAILISVLSLIRISILTAENPENDRFDEELYREQIEKLSEDGLAKEYFKSLGTFAGIASVCAIPVVINITLDSIPGLSTVGGMLAEAINENYDMLESGKDVDVGHMAIFSGLVWLIKKTFGDPDEKRTKTYLDAFYKNYSSTKATAIKCYGYNSLSNISRKKLILTGDLIFDGVDVISYSIPEAFPENMDKNLLTDLEDSFIEFAVQLKIKTATIFDGVDIINYSIGM